MSKKLIFLLLAAVWVAMPSAVASLKYDTLTSADGLSNSSVNCIYQDSTLMMWFGTWDGLNAYNGYGFRTYKFAPDNANTISNNVIRNIVEEAKGILWVATDYGINRIDVENDRIERFYPGYEDNGPTAEQVFSVAAAADGTIFCAATGWGIACYDKALGRLSALNVPQFNSSEIRAVYYGGQNTLLLHTVQEELVRIRYGLSATGSMEVREKVGLFPEGGVKSVFDSRTALYLVTADAEIYRYERRDGELAAVICIHDPLRREAREAVRALHESGFANVVMMTGDNRRTAEAVAAEVGVDAVYAEVLPEDKAAFIRQEKEKGHTVIMVGDGVNDSPALSEADAGIAISTGAAIAREIADITVASEDLFALVTLRRLGEALMERIHGSYRFIVGFNLALIALGVAGVLPPTTSALLHNGSTLGISLRNMTDLLDDEENTQK